jgi:tetratricopeptide (TPR) repeat protein
MEHAMQTLMRTALLVLVFVPWGTESSLAQATPPPASNPPSQGGQFSALCWPAADAAIDNGTRPGLAQDDLQAFVKHYDELFEAGNYAGALAEARKFESAARARYGTQDESYAGALFLQARALYVLGKYLEAEKLYKPALAIFEKARPSAATTRDLAKTLNGLGRVYEHEGRYARLDRATPR